MISSQGSVPLFPEEVKFFTKLGGSFPYLDLVRACLVKMLKTMENAKYLNLKKILIFFIDEKEYLVLFLIINFPCNYSLKEMNSFTISDKK